MKETLLERPTAATALAPSTPTMIWSIKLNDAWNTDSRLTGIATLRISR